MNLNELFEIQARLDNRIAEEHGLEGQDLLDKKILALQVELGELANEWRGFKFWSEDQEPRTMAFSLIDYEDRVRNPLLEEYVDCLHFILSIGLELDVSVSEITEHDGTIILTDDVTKTFTSLFRGVGVLGSENAWQPRKQNYVKTIIKLFNLGELLGFTEQQIYDAYMDKNKINHNRQDTGY